MIGVIMLVKELDFEIVSEYNLEVIVSDSSLDFGKRKKIIVYLRVWVINIDDSGMYIVKVWMIYVFIVFLLNFVGLVGVFYKFDLEVFLVFENGIEIDIILEGDCYMVDDFLKFNGFFSVIINGGFFIVVNDWSLFGIGKLIVYVMNVNFVEVNVIVVGSNNFIVSVVFYFEIFGVLKVIELK